MLLTILLVETALAIYLAGVLVIAITVTMRHGDPSAMYRLYAVRDELIDSVVFKGVDRGDPWLDALYENVNRVLLHSNMLGGPTGWSRAAAAGHIHGNHPIARPKMQPFPPPSEECPEAIRALAPEIRAALQHLLRNHLGIGIQINAREKARRRVQRENAKILLQMMIDDVRSERVTQ
jgi:predicted component of type VI protein secretion system